MAELDNATKRKLESIFDMSGGYVLDFSNASFADFVQTAIGIDPYNKYQTGSKAVLLRTIWHTEPDQLVAKLNLELLEHWRLGKMINNEEPTASELAIHDELKAHFEQYSATSDKASIEFLAKDFGEVDLTALPRELTSQDVVQARLDEIDRCLEAGAPLAVIFLVGSTLEGLLLELALAHTSKFENADTAPRNKERVKPVHTWSLAELIAVADELGVLSKDVSRFADQVRSFRNYIHPRQQLKEAFEPRLETAQIAGQVLRGALIDLESLSQAGGV